MSRGREHRPAAIVAPVLDAVALLLFAWAGRRSHAETNGLAGVAETAWPFLAGAASGWVIAWVVRRRAPVDVRGGLVVWVATVVGGMALRAATGAGTAASFVLVATLVTGVLLVGWRVLAAATRRRGT